MCMDFMFFFGASCTIFLIYCTIVYFGLKNESKNDEDEDYIQKMRDYEDYE